MVNLVTLRHSPDDDAADAVVNDALRTRSQALWRQLTAPEYVLQTERVLRNTLDRLGVSISHRRTEMLELRERRATQAITHEEFERRKDEWQDWLNRTRWFEATVRQYLRFTVDMARAVRGDTTHDELITTLKNLATAVRKHRTDTLVEQIEPTAFDRVLWARLSLLSVRPDETSSPVTLDELAQLPEAADDALTSTAQPVSDNVAMAASLVLELADAEDSVDRPTLTTLWTQRASHLDDNRPSTGKGKRSALFLGTCLRNWEKDAIVRRHTDGGRPRVSVLDRDRLQQLADAAE